MLEIVPLYWPLLALFALFLAVCAALERPATRLAEIVRSKAIVELGLIRVRRARPAKKSCLYRRICNEEAVSDAESLLARKSPAKRRTSLWMESERRQMYSGLHRFEFSQYTQLSAWGML